MANSTACVPDHGRGFLSEHHSENGGSGQRTSDLEDVPGRITCDELDRLLTLLRRFDNTVTLDRQTTRYLEAVMAEIGLCYQVEVALRSRR